MVKICMKNRISLDRASLYPQNHTFEVTREILGKIQKNCQNSHEITKFCQIFPQSRKLNPQNFCRCSFAKVYTRESLFWPLAIAKVYPC